MAVVYSAMKTEVVMWRRFTEPLPSTQRWLCCNGLLSHEDRGGDLAVVHSAINTEVVM